MVKYRKHLDDVYRIEVDKDKSNYKWRIDQSERMMDFPKEFWDVAERRNKMLMEGFNSI